MNQALDSRDYKRRALALFRQQKYQEGEIKMSRGLKLTTIATRQEYLKSYCNQMISWGQQLQEKEQPEKAGNKFKRANSLISGQPTTLFNLGNSLYRQGKVDEALKKYDRALSDRTLDPRIYNNWGYVLCREGRYQEAVLMYEKAIEKDPEHIMAYLNLMVALFYLEKKREAEMATKKILKAIEEAEYEIFDVIEIFQKEIVIMEKIVERKTRLTKCQYEEFKLKFESLKYAFDLIAKELKSDDRSSSETCGN